MTVHVHVYKITIADNEEAINSIKQKKNTSQAALQREEEERKGID